MLWNLLWNKEIASEEEFRDLRCPDGSVNQFPGGLLPLWTTAFHDAPGLPTIQRV
jgi:hypothetical protein